MKREIKVLAFIISLCFVFVACGNKHQNEINGIPESAPGTTWAKWDQNEMLKKRDKYLEDMAGFYQVKNPPQVDLVRFITESEHIETQVKCMNRLGVKTTKTYGGWELDFNKLKISKEVAHLVEYKCEAMYTVDQRLKEGGSENYYPRVSAEELYNYFSQTQKPCLEKLKYKISQPPSLEKWLNNFYFRDSEYWSPFNEAANQLVTKTLKNINRDYESGESKAEINKICPEYPPNFFPTIPNE